jgi:signal transduction histidine kinase
MTGAMKQVLDRIAVRAAWLALVPCLASWIGYALGRSALYHVFPGYQAMSPLTALGLGALAAAHILRHHRSPGPAHALAVAAIAIALTVLGAYVLTGADHVSPWLSRHVFGPRAEVGRVSIATAGSLLLLGVATLPVIRRHPNVADTAAASALLSAMLALIGYLYGANDLYSLVPFRTMAINTAITIFLLACASVLSQPKGGWAHAIALEGPAGSTTRRQLLFTLFPPVLGYGLVRAGNLGLMRLGATLAIFVLATMAPLIWLILRDGRILAELDAERRARALAEREHLEILEERLADQAEQLRAHNAERLALAARDARRSETRYRQLFDSIDAGFCVVEMIFDAQGRPCDFVFIEVNATFQANTGLERAEGRRMRALAPTHAQHWFDVYGRVAVTGEVARFELPAAALDERWYDVHAFPVEVPAGDGSPPHRVGILFNDISARKRAQIALEQINATLEERIAAAVAEREAVQAALRQSQKMEAMGQLTGGVAHDFNNLLTPIIGTLDLLANRRTHPPRETRLLEGALLSADRAKTLVQRLLAFARRQPLQPGPVDIAALVRGMGGLAVTTLGAQVAIATDLPAGLPPALADAHQLEMALLNLCVNARDAMPDGGTLTIAAEERVAGPVHEPPLAPGTYIVLSVADTGIGMDPQTIARATEPFFSTKGIGKGTGLGLSMAHGLAAQLGGALAIDSTPGAGTRIALWLPALPRVPEARPATEPAAPVEEPSGGRTALVVDDDDIVRMTTIDMLEHAGFSVVEARSGQEAEAVLRNGAGGIDMILTDHIMPGMTGADLARSVWKNWPAIPVLLISGYAEAEGIPAELPWLGKPFRRDDLMKAIAGMS